MRRIDALLACSVVASLLVGRRCQASSFYPPIVGEVVGAAEPPPCTTCHRVPTGGLGTATQPFAVYLRSRGLVANDEASLRTALAAAMGEHDDADQDGVADLEELRAGTDPNSADASAGAPPPRYGCGSVAGRAAPLTPWSAVALAAIFAAARLRRVRRRRPR